jgi:hypothetical protein
MKVVFISLCFVFLVVTATDDKNNLKNFKETVADVAGTVGSPEMKAAIEVIRALKTESSTSISNRHEVAGFKSLSNTMNHGSGAVYVSNLDKLVQLWLDDDTFNNLPTDYKKLIATAIREYSLQVIEYAYTRQTYKISFNNGRGELFLLSLSLTPKLERGDVLLWEKFILSATFEPSPPYVIITTSDCNLLSCDRTDQIVYLEASITDAHIRSLIDVNTQFLTSFYQRTIGSK